MAYLAKELTSWAAASWTVGLSSALLLGTTNYAALYYLLRSNLFGFDNARPVSRSEVDPAAPFPWKRGLAVPDALLQYRENNFSTRGREMT